ncbi:hypothetical protein [Nocardioides sp. WS12]|uniref:hypothetical protein n=1 Tax=Nocardioides sp. WS12 TaxID=2486272 RepID=UPI0015FE073E|nr:hypothetical protein [Nocardioides sp. WS12]
MIQTENKCTNCGEGIGRANLQLWVHATGVQAAKATCAIDPYGSAHAYPVTDHHCCGPDEGCTGPSHPAPVHADDTDAALRADIRAVLPHVNLEFLPEYAMAAYSRLRAATTKEDR